MGGGKGDIMSQHIDHPSQDPLVDRTGGVAASKRSLICCWTIGCGLFYGKGGTGAGAAP